MNNFLKTTLACVLGVIIAWILGGIFFIGYIISSVVSAFSSMESESYIPSSETVYHLNLDGNVVDHLSLDPMVELSNAINEVEAPKTLNSVLTSIEKAQHNDYIKGIYLNTDGYTGSYATSTEIRNKLKAFKKSGKFVIAYNNVYSQGQYYLSSVADSIFINPLGGVALTGLSQQGMFFKDALEKLGVEVQIFRVGTFKSAVEPFMNNSMSDANREQVNTYLGSMWNSITENIADTRKISVEELNQLANEGISFRMAKDLTDTGLFDKMIYPSDIRSYFETMLDAKDLEFASFDQALQLPNPKTNADGQIAILYAEGDITEQDSEGIYWKNMLKEIRKIKEDDNIKAVVLRVNSPGGSAFASEQIWYAIEDLKKKVPVVTSMGSLAASGGYYISCNSNKILAEETTLTGSIGVFGMIPNAQDLITNKLGIHIDEVKTNTFGSLSFAQPLQPVEKAMIQQSVEDVYQIFIERCANGRGKTPAEIMAIAEGRVWSGADALRIGLVDQIGGLELALEEAAKLAYLTSYETVGFPQEKELWETLLEDFEENPYIAIKSWMQPQQEVLQIIKSHLQPESRIQARMINNITIQ